MTVVDILVGAAAIAAGARAFLGWGPARPGEAEESDQGDEIGGSPDRTPAVLFLPAVILLLGSLVIGVVPGVERLALAGAQRFEATSAYSSTVLAGHESTLPSLSGLTGPTLRDVLSGVGFTLVTILLGLLVVLPRGLPTALSGPLASVLAGGETMVKRSRGGCTRCTAGTPATTSPG
jgi:hypothetical protein